MYYTAKITEEEGKFVVRFPDCNGCATFGDTLEEARTLASEALNSWLETHLDLGRTPPRPVTHDPTGESIEVKPDVAIRLERTWTKAS